MKFKKIISAVSAFAMAASLFTVASAASLGGKPTVTATFAGYEIDTEYDNQIVAKINFKLDGSAAEALSAYSSSGKGSAKVEKGNGVTTLGVNWSVDGDFEYWDDFNVAPLTLNSTGTSVAFGPKTAVAEYLVDSVLEWTVRYAVYDNDVSGKVVINSASYDGKSTTDKATWSYHTSKSTIDVVGCDIPSYNEWSKPAEPTVETVNADTVALAAPGQDEVAGTDVAAAYKASYNFVSGQTAAWTATGKADYAIDLANISGPTTLGLIVTDGTVSGVALKVTTRAN
jgi:hypothetical protein